MEPLRYRNHGNASLLARIPAGPRRILDVGCGAGDNARILRDRGHRVWGLTTSKQEADVAREICEEVWVGDVETMPLPRPSEPFDVLLMSHVLEHLASPQGTLTRLSTLLTPTGLLAAAVPNMAHWSVRWQILRGDWSRQDTGFFDRTHYQFWSFRTATDALAGTPFEAVEVEPADPGIPLRGLRRVAPTTAAWLDRQVGRMLPNLAASQVLLLARRTARVHAQLVDRHSQCASDS